MLGGALLGPEEDTEAEPLLLKGCTGLKQWTVDPDAAHHRPSRSDRPGHRPLHRHDQARRCEEGAGRAGEVSGSRPAAGGEEVSGGANPCANRTRAGPLSIPGTGSLVFGGMTRPIPLRARSACGSRRPCVHRRIVLSCDSESETPSGYQGEWHGALRKNLSPRRKRSERKTAKDREATTALTLLGLLRVLPLHSGVLARDSFAARSDQDWNRASRHDAEGTEDPHSPSRGPCGSSRPSAGDGPNSFPWAGRPLAC